MTIGFHKIPDALCIIYKKSFMQEKFVFHRKGRLFYKDGANYVGISLNSTEIIEVDFGLSGLRITTKGYLVSDHYQFEAEYKKLPKWVTK